MFDVSFSELLLIGVIALIVIGPERLPKVARTIGHLLGRAQRYVNDVKTDIRREIDADEFSNLKQQMEEAANTVKSSIAGASNAIHDPITEARDALKDAADSVNAAIKPSSQTESDAELPPAPEPPSASSLPLPGFTDNPVTPSDSKATLPTETKT